MKEDPHELLAKSFQQADLWNQGSVKLVAKVHMYVSASGPERNLEYTVFWAGPQKWRAEWSGPDLQQIIVLNNGKLSYVTNQPAPSVRTIEFEAALAALDGGTPAGPYWLAPLAYENTKLHVSKKKINGTEAYCLGFSKPKTTFCIDPASNHLLAAGAELGGFEYSDYTSVGSNSYPRKVKVGSATIPIEDAQVTVTRGEQFPEYLFAAPEKSATADFASCADVATNFSPPSLVKPIKAKRSAAARKASEYGWVWVLATVSKDGSVQKAKVLSGYTWLNPGAIDAVQRYKYSPYMRCGQAVEFQQAMVVRFTPPGPPAPIEQQTDTRPTYPICFPCARQ
jgi:TonB family protein